MAAAAAFTKNGLAKSLRRRHSLHRSTTQPPPKNIGDHLANHQLIQSRWYSRKTKELEFSTPRIISSILSSVRIRSSSSSPNSGLVGWYLGLIKTRPVATKSITSAFIYTAADLSSQTIAGEATEGYDWVRTMRMGGYGMLIIGPSLHYWFNFVSRVFPNRDLVSTFTKMGLGQMVYGPIVTALFFALNAALQGETCSEIVARLKRDLIPTLLSGVMYWPLCDFVTFRFIPVHLQPLVSNSFSYLWTVYLTYMASLSKVGSELRGSIDQ